MMRATLLLLLACLECQSFITIPVAKGRAWAVSSMMSSKCGSAPSSEAALLSERKPRGYWKVYENVEHEVINFVQREGLGDVMPTEAQLRKASLSSLADGIQFFGGYSTIGARLGLKSCKPKGYWQDYANVLSELKGFLSERGATRVVPTQAELRQAGRTDIISGIQLHGGMKRIAEDLNLEWQGRRTVSAVKDLTDWSFFARNLKQFIAKHYIDGEMPGHDVLRNWKRLDLVEAIDHHGGTRAVASKLDLKFVPIAIGLDLVANDLLRFVRQHGTEGVMPSINDLIANGQAGLAAQIDKVGYDVVAKRLGLRVKGQTAKTGESRPTRERVASRANEVDPLKESPYNLDSDRSVPLDQLRDRIRSKLMMGALGRQAAQPAASRGSRSSVWNELLEDLDVQPKESLRGYPQDAARVSSSSRQAVLSR